MPDRRQANTLRLLAAVFAVVSISTFAPDAHASRTVVHPGELIYTAINSCSIGLTGVIGTVHYAISAGHCFIPGAPVSDVAGNPIGFYEAAHPDPPDGTTAERASYGYALIHLYPDVGTDTRAETVRIRSIDSPAQIGQTVCKFGRGFDTSCGQVTDASPAHIWSDIDTGPGDSGAVVYRVTDHTPSGAPEAAFVGFVYGDRLRPRSAIVVPATTAFALIQHDRHAPFHPDLD
jgi:hypothetical protein